MQRTSRLGSFVVLVALIPTILCAGDAGILAAEKDSSASPVAIEPGSRFSLPVRPDALGRMDGSASSPELSCDASPTLLAASEAPPPPPPPGNSPSINDLFPSAEARGDAEMQARLDKRSHMLKIHQRLGIITIAPMLATLFTSSGASGKHGSQSGRDLHAALGLVTAGLYITTATYAIRAPGIPGTEVRGPIKLHKALAWLHGAGMILTPILGAMARSQLDKGEKVHGIASAHGAVAAVTVGAYAAAIGAVALKF
ncbi:MAG TPA: hypothetical protein VFL12_01450 [Thermoanaerobaculia bacterium]|nr:hypothetical protein [Thermoanaerobaculia bacterium]